MSIFGHPSRHPSTPRSKPRGAVYRDGGCRAALPPSQLKTTNMYVYKASVICSLWAQKLFSGPGDLVLAYHSCPHEGPFQCLTFFTRLVDVICLVQPQPFLCQDVDRIQDYFVITP